jgi:hypothetical protein
LPIVGKAIDALLDEAHPELAFFAAWAVRGRRGPRARRIVDRAVELTERMPDALRDAAVRAIVAVLKEPLLEYLKAIAMNPDQLPESRAARRFRQFFEDRGKAEGKLEGVVDGKRAALLTLLDARELSASDNERAMINACADDALLDQWIVRAATASEVAEVLSQPARVRSKARHVARKPTRSR